MGEDTSPELPIPMPEPPPPGPEVPLAVYFPYGPVLHALFSFSDFLIEARFWPTQYEEEPKLWHWFPFGVPAQILLSFVDLIYTNVVKTK